MANPTPPSPELVAEAYRLSRYGGGEMTIAEVAQRLGVSKSCANNYIQKGREQAVWLPDLKEHEHREDIHAFLAPLADKARAMLAEVDSPRELSYVGGQMIGVARVLMDLYGLAMPKRIRVEDGTGQEDYPEPDHALLAAMRRRNAEDLRDLNNGGPGVIEGSKRV